MPPRRRAARLAGPTVLATALIASLPFSIDACAGSAEHGGVVTFGAAGPWNEGYGAMNKRGLDLAVEQINANDLLGQGRTLRVIAENDEGDGAKAANIAQKFVADESVVAVVGHVNSGAMVAAARVYDGHLPAVATTATSPDLSGVSKWVFRVISSDSANGLDLARFASAKGFKRAAILYENNNYGRGLTDSFRRNFTGEIISVDPIADDGTGLEPFISWFGRRDPDVVFVAGTDRSGIALLREARRQGLRAAFLGGDGWTSVLADTTASEGVYVGAPFTDRDPRPAAQRFVAAFRQKYNMAPDGNAALAYDATMLLVQAVRARGANRAAIRDYLADLSAAHPFAGVTGAVHFLPSGDPVGKSFVMTRAHGGSLFVEASR